MRIVSSDTALGNKGFVIAALDRAMRSSGNTVHLRPVRPEPRAGRTVERPSYAARHRPFDQLTAQPKRIKLAKRTILDLAVMVFSPVFVPSCGHANGVKSK